MICYIYKHCGFQFLKLSNLLTLRYSWNTANVGINHQSANKPMNFIKTLCGICYNIFQSHGRCGLVFQTSPARERLHPINGNICDIMDWRHLWKKNVVNSCKLIKPGDISIGNFVYNMELILNRFISMKNEM